MASIRDLAIENLKQAEEPLSLRGLTDKELASFLDGLPKQARHNSAIGLKRFVQFARDTGRIEWDSAEDMLLVLKG
jgi:hypothetical protein